MKPALTTLACWLVLFSLALSAEPESRRYETGPLSAADFAATPPAGRGNLLAATHTGLRYTFQYRGVAASQGVRVVATQLEAFAIVIPAKSWNAAPDDARLMDHEQGHFDISQLHARNWQRQAARLIAKTALAGQGRTQDAAHKALQARVDTELSSINKAWEAEQVLYDKETDHGRQREIQVRWRERLNRELKALTGPTRH